MKESKKKSENQNKEEKISSQPFKRADKVATIKKYAIFSIYYVMQEQLHNIAEWVLKRNF